MLVCLVSDAYIAKRALSNAAQKTNYCNKLIYIVKYSLATTFTAYFRIN